MAKIKTFSKLILLTGFFPVSLSLFSSCSVVSEDSPVKIDKTVFEITKDNSSKKRDFNNLFNLLINNEQQKDENSFYNMDVKEINTIIQENIKDNELIQEKLRLYFFQEIYQAMYSVTDLINGESKLIVSSGERAKAAEKIKEFISKSLNEENKFSSIESELQKITDIKLTLFEKKRAQVPKNWIWELEFKLADDSELAKIIQGDSITNNRGVFYRRNVSSDERANVTAIANAAANASGTFDQEIFDKVFAEEMLQVEYQASKWYWDNNTKIVKSIKLGSNSNPLSHDGTIGGYSKNDSTRSTLGLDFVQHSSDPTLYKPIFLFQNHSDLIRFLSSDWESYLKYKRYLDDGNNKADEEKIKDINIDLKASYIKYNNKI